MEITPPACCTEPLTPCSESDWAQCDICAKLVCTVHDETVHVRHSGEGKYAANTDSVCSNCIAALYEAGEISMGKQYQDINRK